MLTPQDIEDKEFTKAVFGGYDMSAIDNFMEELGADYSALYKDNAILKSKIKVLVEKVEEYRKTEDAMRMALLSAQKMGDDMIAEAKEKSSSMLADAKEKSASMLAESEAKVKAESENISRRIAEEEAKLSLVKKQTDQFIAAVRLIMKKHSDFLNGLDSLQVDAKPEPPAPKPKAEPKAAPESAGRSEADILNAAKEIDAAVSDIVRSDPEPDKSAEPGDADHTQVFRPKDNTVDWSDEGEPTSPRPKFDFENLKFGKNYPNQ